MLSYFYLMSSEHIVSYSFMHKIALFVHIPLGDLSSFTKTVDHGLCAAHDLKAFL